jgi:hypothetical protein
MGIFGHGNHHLHATQEKMHVAGANDKTQKKKKVEHAVVQFGALFFLPMSS